MADDRLIRAVRRDAAPGKQQFVFGLPDAEEGAAVVPVPVGDRRQLTGREVEPADLHVVLAGWIVRDGAVAHIERFPVARNRGVPDRERNPLGQRPGLFPGGSGRAGAVDARRAVNTAGYDAIDVVGIDQRQEVETVFLNRQRFADDDFLRIVEPDALHPLGVLPIGRVTAAVPAGAVGISQQMQR